MTKLSWSNPEDRIFEAGLDRGVLYPNSAPAVSWNGLTSVDENGGESAESYFLDGRPFLYVPKPKEYTATIKAFTYPDAFNPMIGIVEATDGMYLDSQQADSFGLSYRTLIGNTTEGIDFAYKIHLIYKATVTPADISRETLSNSINTTDFSWGIQAVPVKVEGYRASAHIIIDTRHVDPPKLQLLEDALYGTSSTAPYLPDAQDVYDMLNYGDEIIIVDNGDGTWTATGSRANVHMTAEDTWEILNANATNHGDGTYTISNAP